VEKNTREGDDTQDNDEGFEIEPPTEVSREENTEEDCVYEIRAKYAKLVDKEWKAYSAGVLRLYRHKTKGSRRLVIRNEVGKVQLNLTVQPGMKFTKKESKTTGRVFFSSVQDEQVGVEPFALIVKSSYLSELHEKLEQLAAN